MVKGKKESPQDKKTNVSFGIQEFLCLVTLLIIGFLLWVGSRPYKFTDTETETKDTISETYLDSVTIKVKYRGTYISYSDYLLMGTENYTNHDSLVRHVWKDSSIIKTHTSLILK